MGDDLRGLSALGYNCSGWDPVHKKDAKKTSCHVVNVGFVLNVIENPEERIEVLHDAYSLTKKLLVVTTLLTKDISSINPTPFKDGYLTNRNTFQKYYEQSELQQFIEDTLNTSAVPAGPGVFFVFKDPVSAQSFLANRSRRKIDWESISLKLYPDRAERKRIVEDLVVHFLGGESVRCESRDQPPGSKPAIAASLTIILCIFFRLPPKLVTNFVCCSFMHPGCIGGFSTTPSSSIRNCFQKFS